MEVCLIFTGCKPCGEHKVSFVPKFGFTGRICTPSFAENPSFLGVYDRSLRKERFYRTAPVLPKPLGPSGGWLEEPGSMRRELRGRRGRSESNLLLGRNLATLTDLKTRPATTPPPCSSPETGMNPVVWSPSHSLPEPGGLRCLFVLPLMAVFSLDAQPRFWTSSAR
jgi:hypothetical protein